VKALQIEPQVQDLLVYGGLASLGCVILALSLPLVEGVVPPPAPPPKKHFKWKIYVDVQYFWTTTKEHAIDVAMGYFGIDFKPYKYSWRELREGPGIAPGTKMVELEITAELGFGDITTYQALFEVWAENVRAHEYPRIILRESKPPEVTPLTQQVKR